MGISSNKRKFPKALATYPLLRARLWTCMIVVSGMVTWVGTCNLMNTGAWILNAEPIEFCTSGRGQSEQQVP